MHNKSLQGKPSNNSNARKTPMNWIWPVIVAFFALSVIDIRFALPGLICMMSPIVLALAGKGKKHCSHYCPRGSFFGKIISAVSLNGKLPKFMDNKNFKHGLLIFMFTMFGINLYKAGFDYIKVANVIFRMMVGSFTVGTIMGIFFKPRSWCKICPMGHAAGLIKDAKTSSLKMKEKISA